MAVGRITGPLLASNLLRDGRDLAFETDLLYLDVVTGRIGIKTSAPTSELEVAGAIRANQLYSDTATIGLIYVTSGTISTTLGALTLNPSGNNDILLATATRAQDTLYAQSGATSDIPTEGALQVVGGAGITGNLNVGGIQKNTAQIQAYSTATGTLVVDGGVGISQDLWVGGLIHGILTTSTIAGSAINADNILMSEIINLPSPDHYIVLSEQLSGYSAVRTRNSFKYDLNNDRLILGQAEITYASASISTNTGALIIGGGIGVNKGIFVNDTVTATSFVGQSAVIDSTLISRGNTQLGTTSTDTVTFNATVDTDIVPTTDNAQSLGAALKRWETAFFDKVYASTIDSQSGPVTITPSNNLLDINANIRVNGTMPLGTAPVVTNILYVTEDGNDSNDGRAEDPSRACRTISGAVRSLYYTPGTSIRVAPGKYLEQNPIVMLPYTSVLGNDLRTTVIIPINKTQDLFHVQSGCYLFGMQFLNGRSGVLPGAYANGYNRGAYCVAFPPQVNGNKIDTFHSPYVQNCTNQSGPWLSDGIMFQPNQTVQVPLAVGTGTWEASTTTIVVTLSTGTISNGMSVNNGQQNPGFFNARTLLLANKPFIQEQVITYVDQTFPGFQYQKAKCIRDVGIILENISYDSAFGGNEKSVEAGLAYYEGVVSLIAGQELQTTTAINYINTLSQLIINNSVAPDLLASTGTYQQVINTALTEGSIISQSLTKNLNIITTVINSGTNYAPAIFKANGPDASSVSAEILLQANRTFIQSEVISWIALTYPTFSYNTATCYRDVGLIVDAVSQDVLLGGNNKSIEAGISYWEGGYSQIVGQESTTTAAISHAKDVAVKVIENTLHTPTVGNTATQVVNTFFENGFLASDAVSRNFDIINTVIVGGPNAAPERYRGGGLFASTGVQIEETKYAPEILSSTLLGGSTYSITLNNPTIGFGTNATLYFGYTTVFPLQDSEIPEQWAQRRVDTKGGMGGMLVDGSVVSARSPVGSMVLNAYTQVSQGGRGIHIINNGYAQLVSIFTIFCNVAVETNSGGIASITNSNSNFGDICLIAKGYGRREFSGTVYNPAFPAFIPNGQFYPTGYFPQNGQVLIFVSDVNERPSISLTMEVEAPLGYINEQGFPGFVTAAPNTGTVTTGSITIVGVDTTDIAIGQTLHIRDQFGRIADENGIPYLTTGTIVSDLGYQTITLNKSINQGGGEPLNQNYFTLYTCGNAYYTVLSSSVYDDPITVGLTLLPGQQAAEASALGFIGTLTQYVITNSIPPILYQSTQTQTIIPSVIGGSGAVAFIDDKISTITNIVLNGVGVAPTAVKTGTPPSGAGSAIILIQANIEFITQETVEYVNSLYPLLNYNVTKCARDVRLILRQLVYDLESGGNYNSVQTGLSYWARSGTYRLVQLGENLRNPGIMPDGAIVNFYQRSYMSASGYTFEYVGAGMNYGALPQVGRADPVQSKEVVQLNGGKVFFTSTDQSGDFRIGPGLVISQATGVLSGRTFTKSLFAEMTPFILAVEGGI
jgi:hypothetical protein